MKNSDRFDEVLQRKYEFRLAKRKDIPAIMRYIDECWKKGHILSKNRELFEYEFCEGEDVHFLLAIDRATGEIEGLDGYYYTSSRREGDFDIWGSMWSVNRNHRNLPMLGIGIANQYYKQIGYRYELGVGVNTVTATPLHQGFFDVATGILNHFYILNPQEDYKIAVIKAQRAFKAYESKDLFLLQEFSTIEEVESYFDFEKQVTTYPYKDGWYIRHRFFEHPVYRYRVFGIIENDYARAIMVVKKTVCNGKNVIGIVDYIGDITVLKYISNQIYELMEEDTEFMDFFCYGYEPDEIVKAGFVQMNERDENIIPSHFEPYEAKNVSYWFNSDAEDNFVICKADADQDRPNRI